MDYETFIKETTSPLDVKVGTLDDTDLERFCPLDHGRHHANVNCSIEGLGALAVFPQEIFDMIFVRLDVQTLFNCRRLSRRVMHAINSMLAYRDLIEVLPNAFQSALSIETASYISCRTLHRALFKPSCHAIDHRIRRDGPKNPLERVPCQNPGAYLCVLSGRRRCLKHTDSFNFGGTRLPLLPEEAAETYGLSADDLARVKSFRNVPGVYCLDGHICKDRLLFVDDRSAFRKFRKLRGWDRPGFKDEKFGVVEGLLSGRFQLSDAEHTYRPIEVDRNLERAAQNLSAPLLWKRERARDRNFMVVLRAPWIENRERIHNHMERYCTRCVETKDFTCWTVTQESLEKHLQDHDLRRYRAKGYLIQYEANSVVQINPDWPHVETLRVLKTSSTPLTASDATEYWSHEEILARWNGSRFRR